MYSEKTLEMLGRQRRRFLIRRCRQGFLFLVLLVVAIWGWLTWKADNHTFAWDRKIDVAVVALLDAKVSAGEGPKQWLVQRFLSRTASPRRNLREVEEWMQAEYSRHRGDHRKMFEFMVSGPARLETPPPAVPPPDASFWTRLRQTHAFLNYFSELAEREDLALKGYDAKLFVYFYDPNDEDSSERFRQREAIANRRDRIGVVFAPIHVGMLGNTCAQIAHELCHLLGASDKYAGDRCVYPQGFADPHRNPLYPQPKAEIMALGRPVAPGKEEAVTRLGDCIVGEITAGEMGWK